VHRFARALCPRHAQESQIIAKTRDAGAMALHQLWHIQRLCAGGTSARHAQIIALQQPEQRAITGMRDFTPRDQRERGRAMQGLMNIRGGTAQMSPQRTHQIRPSSA